MRDEAPYHLEVYISGMKPAPDGEGDTLADSHDEATYWDVDLRLYLPDGFADPILERSFTTYADASEAADLLLRMFPMATISEWPEH